MLPFAIVPAIEAALEKFTGISGRIEKSQSLGGGSINSCYKIVYADQSFFLKWNEAAPFPEMFEIETKGLDLLSKTNSITVPQVIASGEAGINSYLLLKYISNGNKTKNFWNTFGIQLADLHKNTHSSFGLDHDNYIGSLTQKNDFRSDWASFFVEMRLEPQIRLASTNKLIDNTITTRFSKLFNKIETYFPIEKPSLLHGDLWSGNFVCGQNELPYLIDPAVYYGHREMDLAMSKMFGGFDTSFYQSYNRHFPLVSGWTERTDLCNLYPLMVHVNLFGSSYVSQVKSILRYFVG